MTMDRIWERAGAQLVRGILILFAYAVGYGIVALAVIAILVVGYWVVTTFEALAHWVTYWAAR